MLQSILINLFLNLLNVLFHKPRARTLKAADKQAQDLGEAAPDRLAETTADLLRRHGLEKLMLGDFAFRTRLSKADCKDAPALQRKLWDMMMEVVHHLSLVPLREVTVQFVTDAEAKGRIGEYDSGNRRISFYIQNKHLPEQIAAALCHECTHYFMEVNGLNDWSDRLLNERRTDVMTCLIGFSKIMIDGYMVMTKAHYRVVTWTAESQRVGYLDAEDCTVVRRRLLALRPELERRQAERQRQAEHRRELENCLSGARVMLTQVADTRAVRSAPDTGRLPKRELARLQAALLALESGELEGMLRRAEAASKDDPAQLEAARRDALSVCEALSLILSAYR